MSLPDAISRHRIPILATLGLAAGVAGASAYLTLRPRATPDADTADIDELFDFTLLTKEFNRLPVDERLALVGDLARRLGSMDPSESVMLAAFATRLTAQVRDQMAENVSRLGIDLADEYAATYNPRAEPEEREAYLREAFVDIFRRLERIDGDPNEDMADGDIIAEGMNQAQLDLDAARTLSGEQAGQVFNFMNDVIGRNATTHERVRVGLMMRDMTRMLRNQDVATGLPKGP